MKALIPAAACLAPLCALALPAGARRRSRTPPTTRRCSAPPIEEDVYDHATRCKPRTTPGIKLLEAWVDRHFRGESWGVFRCEKLSKTTTSLHSEGRALDWHLDVRSKAERRAAYFMIDRFLAPDANGNHNALARRMGVQELIFDCRSWFSGSEGLGDYSGCQGKTDRTTAHRDHIHIGLNAQGAAAQTSFWRSPLRDQ